MAMMAYLCIMTYALYVNDGVFIVAYSIIIQLLICSIIIAIIKILFNFNCMSCLSLFVLLADDLRIICYYLSIIYFMFPSFTLYILHV